MNVEIKNLQASIEGMKILDGVDMSVPSGNLVVLMGPNGSGKSTVSNVIMGSPTYKVDAGSIVVDGEDILDLEPHERAKKGIFLSFQNPVEVPGVTVGRFLRRAYEIVHNEVPQGFVAILRKEVDRLGLDQKFINRYLNEGFSGGEKKRMEILQMRVLKPKFAILDEIDSGLDIDAIRIIADAINAIRKERPNFSLMVVTHYRRIVDHLDTPNIIYVMDKGHIIGKGGLDILTKLEEQGYGWIVQEFEGGNDE